MSNRTLRTAILLALGVTISVAGVVFLWTFAAHAGSSRSGTDVLSVEELQRGAGGGARAVLQQVGCQLHGETIVQRNARLYRNYSVASFVNASGTVAKAVITTVMPARFDTLSGAPPTPLPQNATEDEIDDYNDQILSPVVLDVTHVYTGSQAYGFVVIRWGGSVAACPDYTFTWTPQIMTGSVADIGMVFLADPPTEWQSNPPNWFVHLQNAATAMSQQTGKNYEAKVLKTWYLYSGSSASTAHKYGSIPIQQLEAEVVAATGP